MYSSVICDIDGCLNENKGSALNLHALVSIRELLKRNEEIYFSLCTGRSQPYAEAILQVVGVAKEGIPSIVENGCFLYFPHISEDYTQSLVSSSAVDQIKESKKVIVEKFISSKRAKLEAGKEYCISISPCHDESVEELFLASKDLLSHHGVDQCEISHSSTAVDITPKGASKGEGLIKWVQQTGVSVEKLIGIGDSHGDISFLEIVGMPACPANALPAVQDVVKKRNGYISHLRHEEGILDILEHFFERSQ